jgi:hypothetical protein
MVAVGEDGDVFTYVAGSSKDERIVPAPVVLRGLGVIDGFAYACGGNRQVFRRVDEGVWTAMHASAPEPGEPAGFEDICGFSEGEIYAVGWQGEIWQWNGREWTNRDSPTDINLTAVCCADDGFVYACGQNGTLIRGRNDTWELIELESVHTDLWDLCWFNGRLFIASFSTLFAYEEGDLLPIIFESDTPGTFGKLTQAQGVLWSIGTSDVLSFDGTTWTRID